ncbi:MAG: hypothetical protein FWF23_01720 [Alphaproteobacteria bacterium]|nr:hypothetical protein [Alphaproteobacteria bacterium]MCL2505724.1 hypothetical protein [Alphaproteobacteria bacterium]
MSEKFQHITAMTLSVAAFFLLLVNFSLGSVNRAKSNEILDSQAKLETARLSNSLYERVVTLVAGISLRSNDKVLLGTLVNSGIDVSGLNKASKNNSGN